MMLQSRAVESVYFSHSAEEPAYLEIRRIADLRANDTWLTEGGRHTTPSTRQIFIGDASAVGQ